MKSKLNVHCDVHLLITIKIILSKSMLYQLIMVPAPGTILLKGFQAIGSLFLILGFFIHNSLIYSYKKYFNKIILLLSLQIYEPG